MKKQTMKRQGEEEMTLFGMESEIRLGKKNQLVKISQLLNWKKIEEILGEIKRSPRGQEPYDVLKMFKAILLGQWYTLSDPELEESLRVRIDFMRFTGFELMEAFPDETTLCRFRNELSQLGLDKKLFAEINRQLEQRELKVKKCEGALIDATVIESCARPRRVVEEITQDREEKNSSVLKETSSQEKEVELTKKTETPSQYVQTESCDPDARWLKKGKRYYFGYKGFARVDKEGYIEHVHVTSANRSEVKELERALDGVEQHRRVYTDKAYPSKENNELLIRKQLKNGIMSKAVKNKGLNHWQKLRNYLISKVRFRVEQCFGTLKRKFRFTRAAYKTITKVETQFILKAMCYNLLKAARKLEWAT